MKEMSQSSFPYLEMGSAFVIGLAVGIALKKSFKLLLVLLGLGLIFVFVLENQNMISVNEANLQNAISIGGDQFQQMVIFLQHRVEQYKAVGSASAIAGFFVGIKIG